MAIFQQQNFEAGKEINAWPITGKNFLPEEAQTSDLLVKEFKSTILKYAQRPKENCINNKGNHKNEFS